MPSFINRQTEVDFLNRKRKDGLQCPWHLFQMASWVVYLFLFITAFGFILPLLPCSWQSTSYCILGILFLGHFIFHGLTISIDTSSVDPNVPISLREAKKPKPEKMHCHIIPVTFYKEKTRYCHVCGKNVFNFDHHSRIFNTCLGGRNFWFYINSIVTAFLATTCLAIMSLFVFSKYCHQPWVKMDLSNSWLLSFPKASTEIQTFVFLIISFIDGILSLLIASILEYRICFHLYLLCQGLTTQEYYEYLALKKSLHQHHMGRRDLEAAHPSIFTVSRKSHLYLCDTAMQTEQILMENANVTTQTNEEVRFLQETGSQTEYVRSGRQSTSSLISLVERLQTPFKPSRNASAM